MPTPLTGQVAIVTGGGRGIGRTIAETLAVAGAAVAIAGRSAAPLHAAVAAIEATGGHAIAVPVDITDRAAVERMVQEATERLGPVDLFVANAGMIDPIAPLLDTDPDGWWRCFEVNVRGTTTCIRAVLPGMVARRAGRVIALFGGTNEGVPAFSAYMSAKAALLRLVEILGAEMAPHNVQVFALSPGFVRSDMSDQVLAFIERTTGATAIPEYTPAERSGEACVVLASGQGDDLSGRLVRVVDDCIHVVKHADTVRRDDLYVLRYRTLPGSPP